MTAGLMPLGLFLFIIHYFFWWSLARDLRFSLSQTNGLCKLSINISIIFRRLAQIRQNFQTLAVTELEDQRQVRKQTYTVYTIVIPCFPLFYLLLLRYVYNVFFEPC